jgi:hypothetical protein
MVKRTQKWLMGLGAIQFAIVTIPHTVKSAPQRWHNLQNNDFKYQFAFEKLPSAAVPSRT